MIKILFFCCLSRDLYLLAMKGPSLHEAAKYGNRALVARILDGNAAVNSRDEECKTPLHHASCSGYLDTVQLLVRRGADIKAEDSMRYTPFHRAQFRGHRDVTSFLQDTQDLNNLLFPIIESKDRDHIVRLLDWGAQINSRNENGDTPLHYAVACGLNSVAKFLLRSGAAINTQNNEGETPIYVAMNKLENPIARPMADLLVRYGADMTIEDKKGISPLTVFCSRPLYWIHLFYKSH